MGLVKFVPSPHPQPFIHCTGLRVSGGLGVEQFCDTTAPAARDGSRLSRSGQRENANEHSV